MCSFSALRPMQSVGCLQVSRVLVVTPLSATKPATAERPSKFGHRLQRKIVRPGNSNNRPVYQDRPVLPNVAILVPVVVLTTAGWAGASPDYASALNDKVDVFQLMLQHPLLTMAAAGAATYTVPRLVSASLRYLVAPAVLFMCAWLCVTYPEMATAFVTTVIKIVSDYPVQVSWGILLVLALLLVPSLLTAAAGAATVAVLSHFVFNTELPLLPAPEIKPSAVLRTVSGAVSQGEQLQKQLKEVSGSVVKTTSSTYTAGGKEGTPVMAVPLLAPSTTSTATTASTSSASSTSSITGSRLSAVIGRAEEQLAPAVAAVRSAGSSAGEAAVKVLPGGAQEAAVAAGQAINSGAVKVVDLAVAAARSVEPAAVSASQAVRSGVEELVTVAAEAESTVSGGLSGVSAAVSGQYVGLKDGVVNALAAQNKNYLVREGKAAVAEVVERAKSVVDILENS